MSISAMTEIGLAVPASGFAYSLDEAITVGREIGFPIIIRPSFILGGRGTGIAADEDELRDPKDIIAEMAALDAESAEILAGIGGML